ncbi:hypothetical protein Q3G72_002753 [Acer saccharum]|nr:hypothetical protein Q3G72_002753 [Acer saccharum]
MSRKKKSRVVDLVQAFEMVTGMEEGNHDCLLEQEAIKLEDEKLAKITLVEIGELERDNEKLMLEVRMLKAENGLLRNKVQEFSTSNEELGEQVVMLEEKKKATSKNLEDLAKLSEEFEEENSRRFRKMFIVVEKSTNTVMEFQEWLNKKEDELKRTKVKEVECTKLAKPRISD